MLTSVSERAGIELRPECRCHTLLTPHHSPVPLKAGSTLERQECSCDENNFSVTTSTQHPIVTNVRNVGIPHVASTPVMGAMPFRPHSGCSCSYAQQTTSAVTNIVPLHPVNCLCWDVQHVPYAAQFPVFHKSLCTCPAGIVGLAVWNGQKPAEEACICGFRDEQSGANDRPGGHVQHCRRRLWPDEGNPSLRQSHASTAKSSACHASELANTENSSSYTRNAQCNHPFPVSNIDPNLRDWQRRHLENLAAQKMEVRPVANCYRF